MKKQTWKKERSFRVCYKTGEFIYLNRLINVNGNFIIDTTLNKEELHVCATRFIQDLIYQKKEVLVPSKLIEFNIQ